jgi:hypothetical protein
MLILPLHPVFPDTIKLRVFAAVNHFQPSQIFLSMLEPTQMEFLTGLHS